MATPASTMTPALLFLLLSPSLGAPDKAPETTRQGDTYNGIDSYQSPQVPEVDVDLYGAPAADLYGAPAAPVLTGSGYSAPSATGTGTGTGYGTGAG